MACGPMVKPCTVIVNMLVGIDAAHVFRAMNELVKTLTDTESPVTLDKNTEGITSAVNKCKGYVKVMKPPGSIAVHGRNETVIDA